MLEHLNIAALVLFGIIKIINIIIIPFKSNGNDGSNNTINKGKNLIFIVG